MTTLFTHGYIGLSLFYIYKKSILAQALGKRKYLTLFLFIMCSIIPDIDIITLYMGIPYGAVFGHRGFTHSIFFALILPLLLIVAFYRNPKVFSRDNVILYSLFFLSTMSHSILDALTNGGHGVAFFAPFYNHRFFFPITPIQVSPLSIQGIFSWRIVYVLASELFIVVIPISALSMIITKFQFKNLFKYKLVRLLSWGLVVLTFVFVFLIIEAKYPTNSYFYKNKSVTTQVIELYKKSIVAWDPFYIPVKGRVIINFDVLKKNNFFNRTLKLPKNQRPWSFTFIPSWFGGIAGRWQNNPIFLIMRTILGFDYPTRSESINLLHWASRGDEKSKKLLFELSPTEKYDLAMGDYFFNSSKEEAKTRGHNKGFPMSFWDGMCNGVATMSAMFEDPFRKVSIISPDGFEVIFHPNDIKALMSKAAINFTHTYMRGTPCQNTQGNLDSVSCRDLNPGLFVIALINKIGIDKKSFIIDTSSFHKVHNDPVTATHIRILKGPKEVTSGKSHYGLPKQVKYLVDMEIIVGVSSTNEVSYTPFNKFIDKHFEDGYYESNKVIRKELAYQATIALDAYKNIIGGKWTNESMAGPDVMWFVDESYMQIKQGPDKLNNNKFLRWTIIKKLYDLSVSRSKSKVVLNLLNFGAIETKKGLIPQDLYKKMVFACYAGSSSYDCNNLGNYHYYKQDPKKAHSFYFSGCMLRNPLSCLNLARGFLKDKKENEALKYYKKACFLGNKKACKMMDKLEKKT